MKEKLKLESLNDYALIFAYERLYFCLLNDVQMTEYEITMIYNILQLFNKGEILIKFPLK